MWYKGNLQSAVWHLSDYFYYCKAAEVAWMAFLDTEAGLGPLGRANGHQCGVTVEF